MFITARAAATTKSGWYVPAAGRAEQSDISQQLSALRRSGASLLSPR